MQIDTVEARRYHREQAESQGSIGGKLDTAVYQATPQFGDAPEPEQRPPRHSVQYVGDQIVRKALHFPEYFRISPPYSSRRAVRKKITLWRI
ncbi:hypothetical protein EUGRSUZ_E03990 [Eucalyptus grandis]|uniref:Uncharacterized protein n=2 Tax=Eucalyptus grandis TaxID=71139 RepID=A0ACC3L1F0_EUCGR|nr:hypothetical protein EUGRSUZ_E03990 [Eucalyptus grandis]